MLLSLIALSSVLEGIETFLNVFEREILPV